MGPEERRAAAFARWFDERTCSRIEPWRWGTVFVDEEFPHISDSNFLSIEGLPADEPTDLVVAEVERARLDAGIGHRRVVVADARLAVRLAPAFDHAGWTGDRYALMVQRRVPQIAAERPAAHEVALDELLRFRERLEADTGAGEPLRARRAYAEKIDRAVGTRCYLASVDGRAAGGCVLWIHGADAMLDAVATLPAFRGRGAAGAAVTAAADAARAAGATWVHLYTNAATGPVALYERLGFDGVSSLTEFVGA